MKILPILHASCIGTILLLSGCFTNYDAILVHPSSEWSSRDCINVMMDGMSSNIAPKNTTIRVIATLYSFPVILAINRNDQRLRHLTEEEFRTGVERQTKEDLGLYVDWNEGKLVDGRGNYYRNAGQLDSLSLLISIENAGWPCGSIWISNQLGIAPLFSLGLDPCYMPEITDIERRIFLANDRGEMLSPMYVTGRRNDLLTMEETLFAKFPLRSADGSRPHFLSRSEKIWLVIEGFTDKIRLEFPVRSLNYSVAG